MAHGIVPTPPVPRPSRLLNNAFPADCATRRFVFVTFSHQRRRRQAKEVVPEELRRRSTRERNAVNYAEVDSFRSLAGVDDEDLAAARRRGGGQARANVGAAKLVALGEKDFRSRRYSVGSRVYDSENGVTCHWCRQKTVETHVTCTAEGCGRGRMPVSFCGMCLRNRHGEDIDDAVASGEWVCPKCRGNCGEGCVTCCNCGPCRKAAGLSPTHQMISIARSNGFDNVHDYLVHSVTNATPAQLLARKTSFAWGKWLTKDFSHAKQAASGQDSEGEEKGSQTVTTAAGEAADRSEEEAVISTPALKRRGRPLKNASPAAPAAADGASPARPPSPGTPPHAQREDVRRGDDDASSGRSRAARATRRATFGANAEAKRNADALLPRRDRSAVSRDIRDMFRAAAKKPAGHRASDRVGTKLKPAGDGGKRRVEAPPDDVFEVERVLKRRKGGTEVLILWKGYPLSEATWEPVTNLLT